MEPHVLARDPGESVGLAAYPLARVDEFEIGRLWSSQFHQNEAALRFGYRNMDVNVTMWTLVEAKRLNAVVIVDEQFILHPKGRYTEKGLSPYRQNAMLVFALAMKWFDMAVQFQTASLMKGTCTPARMKMWGLALPYKRRHEQDARGHLVEWIRRLKNGEVSLPDGTSRA